MPYSQARRSIAARNQYARMSAENMCVHARFSSGTDKASLIPEFLLKLYNLVL